MNKAVTGNGALAQAAALKLSGSTRDINCLHARLMKTSSLQSTLQEKVKRHRR